MAVLLERARLRLVTQRVRPWLDEGSEPSRADQHVKAAVERAGDVESPSLLGRVLEPIGWPRHAPAVGKKSAIASIKAQPAAGRTRNRRDHFTASAKSGSAKRAGRGGRCEA